MWIDSHCHLDQLNDNTDDIIQRASDAGVQTMVTICTQPSDWPKVTNYLDRYDNVYAAVGLHPHYVDNDYQKTSTMMLAWLDHPKVIAIGETGLDYHYATEFAEQQRISFDHHLEVAHKTNLPIVIHSRSADADTIAALSKRPVKGILHCFSHDLAMAQAALDAGLYISISGIATFNRSEDIRQAIAQVPLDRLLLETDAPYLAPVPERGKPNEPSLLPHTAACLAKIKNVDLATLSTVLKDNFYNVFNKIDKASHAKRCA